VCQLKVKRKGVSSLNPSPLRGEGDKIISLTMAKMATKTNDEKFALFAIRRQGREQPLKGRKIRQIHTAFFALCTPDTTYCVPTLQHPVEPV
jgi:hypothetical protein